MTITVRASLAKTETISCWLAEWHRFDSGISLMEEAFSSPTGPDLSDRACSAISVRTC